MSDPNKGQEPPKRKPSDYDPEKVAQRLRDIALRGKSSNGEFAEENFTLLTREDMRLMYAAASMVDKYGLIRSVKSSKWGGQ